MEDRRELNDARAGVPGELLREMTWERGGAGDPWRESNRRARQPVNGKELTMRMNRSFVGEYRRLRWAVRNE